MGKLSGSELNKLENMQFRKSKMGFMAMGTMIVREDGIAFYKAKGALLGRSMFGLLGAAATRNNTSPEPDEEYGYSEIRSVHCENFMMTPTIFVDLQDGSTVYFSTQSRMFNGKGALETAAACIQSKLGSAN